MEQEKHAANDLATSKESRECEHLDGLEREKHGLPYSREEHDWNLRRIEQLRDYEQQEMRRYTDYTLTTLEFTEELDLEHHSEWNSTLRHVHDHDNCLAIVWGREVGYPRRVLALIGTPILKLIQSRGTDFINHRMV